MIKRRPESGKRDRHAAGLLGERLAALLLMVKGYRILARRLRTPAGELDIVARRGRTLAFVEVKTRPDAVTALHAVSPRQRARIARAAGVYVARHPVYAGHDLRFDLIWVAPPGLPHHLPDAWRS